MRNCTRFNEVRTFRGLSGMGRSLLPALALATMVLLALNLATGSATASSQYWVDESSLPFEPLPGHEDSTRLWGVHAGAGYRIEVPAAWNGDLVMWAHGLRVGHSGFTLPAGPWVPT